MGAGRGGMLHVKILHGMQDYMRYKYLIIYLQTILVLLFYIQVKRNTD